MLDLIKESVDLYNMHTTKWQKAKFESDCIIPDTLPDILNISAVSTHAETNSITKAGEGTRINFNIIFKILYTPENIMLSEETQASELKTFCHTTEQTVIFNDIFPEDAEITPIYGIENTESTISNSRKLSLTTTLNISLSATYHSSEEVCSEITGDDDIQCQKEIRPLIIYDNNVADLIEINEGIELSSIKAPYKEILRSDAALRNVTTSAENSTLTIKGNLEITTLYVADDATGSMQIIENETSFIHNITTEYTEDIIWNTDLQLTDFDTTIIQDGDNENRILQITGKILVNAYSWKSQNVELLNDAYSLSKNITLERKPISVFDEAESVNSQFVIKDSIILNNDAPKLSQIININAEMCDYNCISDAENITINGNITTNIFYIFSDQVKNVRTATESIPFQHVIENLFPNENTKISIRLSINHVSYNILSDNEIELRISVSAKGILAKVCDLDVITGINESEILPDERDKPSILLYVVQTNDSLWKIAKKYNSPIDLLKEINHIRESDSIIPGQKILIPC